MLKVFSVRLEGMYASGLAVVAAEDERAARELAELNANRGGYQEYDAESVEHMQALQYNGVLPGVLTSFQYAE